MKLKLPNSKTELLSLFRHWCAKADEIRVVTAWATADRPAHRELKSAAPPPRHSTPQSFY